MRAAQDRSSRPPQFTGVLKSITDTCGRQICTSETGGIAHGLHKLILHRCDACAVHNSFLLVQQYNRLELAVRCPCMCP